jgi:hypothetical protein
LKADVTFSQREKELLENRIELLKQEKLRSADIMSKLTAQLDEVRCEKDKVKQDLATVTVTNRNLVSASFSLETLSLTEQATRQEGTVSGREDERRHACPAKARSE